MYCVKEQVIFCYGSEGNRYDVNATPLWCCYERMRFPLSRINYKSASKPPASVKENLRADAFASSCFQLWLPWKRNFSQASVLTLSIRGKGREWDDTWMLEKERWTGLTKQSWCSSISQCERKWLFNIVFEDMESFVRSNRDMRFVNDFLESTILNELVCGSQNYRISQNFTSFFLVPWAELLERADSSQ